MVDTSVQHPNQPLPQMRLLRTKLFVPPAHPDLVPRSRLLRRLDRARHSRLTTVTGPAGSGKTTLISDWIRDRGLQVSWVSLDAADDDPRRFWTYLAAALDVQHPGLGRSTLTSLQAAQSPPFEAILTDLINEIAALSDETLLILDDYHVIEAAEIQRTVEFFLLHLPPQAHVIIASRSEPPLPLVPLRTRRQLCELGASDLRFTSDETTEFLNRVLGLSLSAEDVLTLEARTEGWAAALQLAGLSLQEVEDASAFIRAFGGSQRHVFDYLAQEILWRQPPAVRAFLLKTGILDRLRGPLCDAVTRTGEGQQMLERLEATNLLLTPCDQERHWYRYHHLFADFLRLQVEQESGAEAVAELHRRASAWYENHDFLEDAVAHALAAKDYDGAARIVESHAEQVFWRSELHSLVRWVKELPEAQLDTRPKLGLVDAWAQLATGQPLTEVERRLQGIERAVGRPADVLGTEEAKTLAPEVIAALVEITIIRSSLTMTSFDPQRIRDLVQRALPYLTENAEARLFHQLSELRPVASFNLGIAHELSGEITAAAEAFADAIDLSRKEKNLHLLPLAFGHLAALQMVQGRLHRAADAYQEAVRSAAEFGVPPSPMAGMVHVGLGSVFYEWNELAAALTHLEQGITLGKRWNNLESLTLGYIVLARVRQAQGDWQEAFHTLDELAEACRQADAPTILPAVEAMRTRLWIGQGNLGAVARWVEASTIPLGNDQEVPYSLEGEAMILARALVALGRREEAQRLMRRLLTAMEAGQRWGRAIEVLVIQALAYQAEGQRSGAQRALRQALEMAAPEGFMRAFVDEGAPVAEILRSMAPTTGPGEYPARLLAAFSAKQAGRSKFDGSSPARPSGPAAQGALAEPLSDREREVLRLIADGLKNEEIAAALVVSTNTVKSHIGNIYGKLRVRNRTEAIARAQALKLL